MFQDTEVAFFYWYWYMNFANFFFFTFPGSMWSLSVHVSSFKMPVSQMNCTVYRWWEVQTKVTKVYFGKKEKTSASDIYMLPGVILYFNSCIPSFLYFNSCLFISSYLDAPKCVYFYNSQSACRRSKPCDLGISYQLYNEDERHAKSYLIMQK